MIKDVPRAKLDKTLHANLFNSTILPPTLYLNQTWAITMKEKQRLVMTQTAMKKSMLGISLSEYIQSKTIWQWSRMKDVRSAESRSFTGLEMLRDSQTTGGSMQLSSGIQETGNNHSKKFPYDKRKLSSNSGQYGEKG